MTLILPDRTELSLGYLGAPLLRSGYRTPSQVQRSSKKRQTLHLFASKHSPAEERRLGTNLGYYGLLRLASGVLLFLNMSILLYPWIQVFRYSLQPIAPFSWFGLGITTLDVVATFRLCLALRQIRDTLYAKHLSSKAAGPVEEKSFIKNLLATLIVVYGGEALACMIMFFIHNLLNSS